MRNAILILLFLFVCSHQCEAQINAYVTWSLTANTRVSTMTGNVVGSDEVFSFSSTDSALNLVVRDYAASDGGQRIHLGTTNWPYETAENAGRYVQFVIAPLQVESLHVTSISLEMGAGGTSAMNANIYYSDDSTFTSRQRLNATSVLPNGAWLTPSPSYQVDVTVSVGKKFYVRIYPWYNSSNASTSKYVYLRNVTIAGITASGTSTPLVTTAPASNVTSTSAQSGGTVVWDGGSTVLSRGVCWNASGNPTTSDSITVNGSGTGAFFSTIDGLMEGTRYFVRAYAINSLGTSYGNEVSFIAENPPPRLSAFPGAEGFGKYASGGRGGVVYEVTNLNDAGPGSLRAAVQASGSRTVVFRVSGTITLNSNLTITNPNITIAGQTAPGDGICIRRYPLTILTNNVIIRYLRIRLGNESGQESDAFGGRGCSNLIIDHCSASWSVDETLSFYWCDSTTIQWCFITESMYNSNHPKGAHGYGGIWGGPNATFHHNLFAHHSSRNPRFGSGVGVTDYRNNVIYNWGFNSAYGGEDTSDGSPTGHSRINMVANYYKPGNATATGRIRYRIANPSTHRTNIYDVDGYGRWFIDQNYVVGFPGVSSDNWTSGVQPQGGDSVKMGIRSTIPFDCPAISQQSATDAYSRVLDEGGASKPTRDSVDRRIVREVRDGAATFSGLTYPIDHPPVVHPCGIIDSQTDVGGWPQLNSTSPPQDADHDGMPDTWEQANGLNPNDPNDRNGIGADGYTNLEIYLNSPQLISGVEPADMKPEIMRLYPNYPNPFNSATTLEFSIPMKGAASVKVYDMLGRVVARPFEGNAEGGRNYRTTFDTRDLSSGVYFASLESQGQRLVQRMMLLK